MLEKQIVVNLRVEGIHQWKQCDLPDVGYLKEKHRHIFHITAKKIVYLNNRQIEVITFKREIDKFLLREFGSPCQFENASCESIAELLLKEFHLSFCSVLEDGENGAEIISKVRS